MVVAADPQRGIGYGGGIPWKLRRDMQFFKKLTCATDPHAVEREYEFYPDANRESPATLAGRAANRPNAVIMGYRTWESLPSKFKPLPGRLNLVMTRQNRSEDPGSRFPGAKFCGSLEAALSLAEEEHCPNTYVIGGAQVYEEAIKHPGCQSLYITALSEMFSCDTFFPEYENLYRETRRSPVFQEDWISFRFKVFERN